MQPTSAGHTLYTDVATGALKERRFKMLVKDGPDAGATFPLESGTILVGTHENNDIVLKDDTVSRYHLEIQVRASGLHIQDQSTTNGTFFGEADVGSMKISSVTRLRLGKNTHVELVPVEASVELGPYGKERFGKVVGTSPAMQELFAMLSRVAPTDATLLLEGETGTGKELVAEAVHAHSLRSSGPMVVVDCGSIPATLIASELFGHLKGAFTGAAVDKPGLIKSADGGTLFLDEIGELSLELQPQLLRVLEKREIRHVGDTRPQAVDIRVIAATHRNLLEMVKEGSFREDLYYRLAVVRAILPPLRDRGQDIALLANQFADEFTSSYNLSPSLIEALSSHPWDGNVRELRNVVERALSLRDASGSADPARILGQPLRSSSESDTPPGGSSADVLGLPFKEAKGQLVEDFERDYLEQLLNKHKGNISQAASEAGIDRNYIHRLVKKYGIVVKRD
jgi:transcriptional regulator with GAF, ATPase, and Fis domain